MTICNGDNSFIMIIFSGQCPLKSWRFCDKREAHGEEWRRACVQRDAGWWDADLQPMMQVVDSGQKPQWNNVAWCSPALLDCLQSLGISSWKSAVEGMGRGSYRGREVASGGSRALTETGSVWKLRERSTIYSIQFKYKSFISSSLWTS